MVRGQNSPWLAFKISIIAFTTLFTCVVTMFSSFFPLWAHSCLSTLASPSLSLSNAHFGFWIRFQVLFSGFVSCSFYLQRPYLLFRKVMVFKPLLSHHGSLPFNLDMAPIPSVATNTQSFLHGAIDFYPLTTCACLTPLPFHLHS